MASHRRQENGEQKTIYPQILRRKNFQPTILNLAKFSNKFEGGVEVFSNMQRAKTTKSLYQETTGRCNVAN